MIKYFSADSFSYFKVCSFNTAHIYSIKKKESRNTTKNIIKSTFFNE